MSDGGLHTRIAELLDTLIDPCSAAVRVVVRVTHPSCFMAPLFLAQV